MGPTFSRVVAYQNCQLVMEGRLRTRYSTEGSQKVVGPVPSAPLPHLHSMSAGRPKLGRPRCWGL